MELTELCFYLLVIALPLMILHARSREKKAFNNGYCKECNSHLRLFDMDSQGGRGYICDKCGYQVWVSYMVDKNYKRD